MATALPLAYDSHSELELHREYSVDGSTTPTPTRTRKRKRLPSLTSSSSCSSDDEDIVGARRTRIRGRAHSTRYEALAWDEGLPISRDFVLLCALCVVLACTAMVMVRPIAGTLVEVAAAVP